MYKDATNCLHVHVRQLERLVVADQVECRIARSLLVADAQLGQALAAEQTRLGHRRPEALDWDLDVAADLGEDWDDVVAEEVLERPCPGSVGVGEVCMRSAAWATRDDAQPGRKTIVSP